MTSVLTSRFTGPIYSKKKKKWKLHLYIQKNNAAQKMKFSIKDIFSKYDQNCSFLLILVTFTEEILNGNFIFCAMRIKFKGALSGLGQSLSTETPLKLMKNAFYFTLKALFVLKIFKSLS